MIDTPTRRAVLGAGGSSRPVHCSGIDSSVAQAALPPQRPACHDRRRKQPWRQTERAVLSQARPSPERAELLGGSYGRAAQSKLVGASYSPRALVKTDSAGGPYWIFWQADG